MRFVRHSLSALALLFVLADVSTARSQEDAKSIYATAQTTTNQCEKVKLICKAAKLDKKFRSECDSDATAISAANKRYLEKGYQKLESKSLDSAKMYANNVCELDDAAASSKLEFMTAIKAAATITVAAIPPAPAAAVPVPAKEEPKSADIPKPAPAPVSVAAPPVQVAGITPPPPPVSVPQNEQPNQHPAEARPANDVNRDNDRARQVAGYLDRARKATTSSDYSDALKNYEAARLLQPGNPDVLSGLKIVQGKINSRPEEQAKVLASAIKAFYRSSYDEAENSLIDYLGYSGAKYRGAAYFYLGVTRLYKSVLYTTSRKPDDAIQTDAVQSRFREARLACYKPIDKYLSPLMARAWSVSAGAESCSKQ